MVIYEFRAMIVEAFRGYIASDEWRFVKQEVTKRDNSTCVDCKKKLPGGKGSIIHHEHYEDWGKGNLNEINSCVFLCKNCHNIRHAKPDMKMRVPFLAKQYPETD